MIAKLMIIIRRMANMVLFRTWYLYRLLFKPYSLEIHLAEHCNLNCAGCNHYSPLAEPAFCNLEQLESSLRKLVTIRKSLRTIRLLGGEPLLNPDIVDIFRLVREYLKDSKIELVTNGVLLMPNRKKQISDTFWEACRNYDIIILLTIYPINLNYSEIEDTCKKHGVRVKIWGDRRVHLAFHLFRLNPAGCGSLNQYYHCSEIGCMQLAGDKIYPCAESAYVRHLNKAFGYEFKHRNGDYIEVHKIKNIFTLWLFRLRRKPFCSYCVFPRISMDWKQSERKVGEWIEL